ncbi:bZIP transcription factor [Aspergillus stella-maris]|uniref:bZIP transcription factor n=1 Tax=Aspergillus stella-maris TaxID=1810926 RepID=UPI003CCCEC71
MTTQVFYPTDPLDGSIAPDTLFMGNDFPPEFLSLAALDKDHHELPMGSMQYQPGLGPATMHMAQAMHQPTQQDELQNRPRLCNRALRPAPRDMRKDSIDDGAGMNARQQQPPFLDSYHPTHSFSSFSFNSNSTDHDADFTYDNDPHHDNHDPSRISPLSNASSGSQYHKSPSPTSLRWHNANGSNDTEKRAKHLERNRAAASKSRQKKKRETDSLRSRFQEASRRKSGLEIEIKDLHSQLLSLKDQILMHSRCDDDAIRVYLGRMVKQATRTDSLSSVSVSSGDVEAESRRASDGHPHSHEHEHEHDHGHEHSHDQVADRIASSEELNNDDIPDLEQQQQKQAVPQQQIPMRMGDATLPCGIEKSMMGSMFPHGEGNIFDLQMSMT